MLAFSLFSFVNAQIVDIPDRNFKKKLLASSSINNNYTAQDLNGRYFAIDANRDGEIQVNEARNVSFLDISQSDIFSLEGISIFSNLKLLNCSRNSLTSLDGKSLVNLTRLDCYGNILTSLDVTGLVNLEYLDCKFNYYLTSIDLTGLVNLKNFICHYNKFNSLDMRSLVKLEYFECSGNQFTSLDLTSFENLIYLDCSSNQLTSLVVTGLVNLKWLNCSYNQLTSLDLTYQMNLLSLILGSNKFTNLFIKNVKKLNSISFHTCPNLKYICAEEEQYKFIKEEILRNNVVGVNYNSYCSFTPAGTYYTLEGNSKLDLNLNGCDNSDEKFPNLNFSITDGINKANFISDNLGYYSIPVQEGTYTLTPNIENPNYFTVSPPSISVTFPTQTSPFVQNFCISPNGVHNDLEVTILPTIPARPGFDAAYKIIYKNKGNQTQSGSVVLSFNDAVLDLVSAIPVANSMVIDKLTWDYNNLKPLESREITVTFNVNSPMETPAVNNGDRLSFNALITPVAGDEKPVDNSFALRQTVVGSYDPNDKTCLEGDVITPDLIGEYVHYLIRFENTGTYPAENVVIKDLIDLTKFDISTLTPTKASHDYVIKISDGNKVEFIFEKIQLPFDDANNDGYIAFKIKTLPTLVVGDSFTNEANIYFDYNFPILTNTAKSTFQTLGTQDFEFADYFSLYPNPVTDIVNIETKNNIEIKSMAVYDVLGQLIIAIPDASTVSTIDVSKLTTGNYFLKMNTNKGTSNGKFIKK